MKMQSCHSIAGQAPWLGLLMAVKLLSGLLPLMSSTTLLFSARGLYGTTSCL